MSTFNVTRSLQSFVVLPILAANLLSASPVQPAKLPIAAVSLSSQNGLLAIATPDNQQSVADQEAQQINEYFSDIGSPLTGYGKEFVEEADQNGLPWNLEAGIVTAESTAYIHPCKSDPLNGFGWNSCKGRPFTSINNAIDVVATNLGGNNPSTAKWYAGKSIQEILAKYNPPRIAPEYIKHVTEIMQTIQAEPVQSTAQTSAVS